MNILIPHQWLLEHLSTSAQPSKIAELLSLSGPSVEHMYDRENEVVYDIEVTTNRVDSMSIRGIAREAAVILQYAGVESQLQPTTYKKITDIKPTADVLPLPKITNNPELNNRTLCVVLDSVTRAETPDWMAQRLRQTEMNVHDAVIDITNYITHELGHPCHAFDYHKLMNTGGEINIVEAEAGETFTTLDSNEFTTVGGEVVFKNGEGTIIDLPSIKGTANTSVDENTTAVLLLMESIRADKVRFASMTHAIRTTAAQLMEKHVDPNLASLVLARGVQLYQDLCGAEIASEVYDDFDAKTEPKPITVPLSTVTRYLGIELPVEDMTEILEMLECKVEVIDDTALIVTPPTFRPDLNIPADIVEEIARIYGYHRLPSTLMPTAIPTNKPAGTDYQLENELKHFLANHGWQEVYTYSMVSQDIAEQSGIPLVDHISLANPLTEDREVMRRSLLPSLQEILDQNPERKDLTVFELAHVYHPQENDIPEQILQVGIVSNQSYREVKGIVEALLSEWYLHEIEWRVVDHPANNWHQSAEIIFNKEKLGTIGITKTGSVGVELDMQTLVRVAKTHPEYQPLAKAAAIKEDLTFTIPEKVAVGSLMAEWKKLDDTIISIELVSMYQQNMSFRFTYQHPTDNLSVDAIAPTRKKIVAIAKEHHADLVGAV